MPYCGNCGITISGTDKFCGDCGDSLTTGLVTAPKAIPQPSAQPKSVGLAACIALFLGFFGILGIGHFYAGSIIRGIVFLGIGFILDGIFFIIGFAGGVIFSSGLALWVWDDIEWLFLIWILCLVVFGLVYLWQCADACRVVQKWNRILAKTGEKPW